MEKVKKTFRSESDKLGEEPPKAKPEPSGKFSVIEKHYDEALFEEKYTRLIRELKLGKDKRSSYDAIGQAIDNVSDNARIAGEMYVHARQEFDDFEDITFAIWWSDMASIASRALEKLKSEGNYSGQVSEGKVRDWIIKNKNLEYKEMMQVKSKLKKVSSLLEILSKQWERKASLLQTQANLIEKRKILVLGGKNDG